MMITFKRNILFYAIVGIALLHGCSKQLDLKPTDTINENNAYRTMNDAQMGTNGAYAYYGAFLNDIFLSAYLSDEAKLGPDNAGQGALTYRYQVTSESGDIQGGYANYYRMIDQVNRVLAALPNVVATASEEPRRNILKGQLLALRGIAYFGLLQSFCKNYNPTGKGVPIMLAPDPGSKPGHNTMGEVMTRIETDMNEAFGLLANTAFSDTVMNRFNINAYRARIALYKGDYDSAIQYATFVINANVVQMATTTATFNSIWTEGNYPTIPESLFRIRNLTSTALGSFWTTQAYGVTIAPSDKLFDVYEANDIRRDAYIGLTNGKRYVKKHESVFAAKNNIRIVDLKAIRLAEMYLIRAEAYAKQASPNLTAGKNDLDYLRARRFIGAAPALPVITSAEQLIGLVLSERYRELCFEGSRFFDLRRNNLPVSRAATDAATAWQNLPAGDNFFVMPIPFAEIQANPNAIQNPGY